MTTPLNPMYYARWVTSLCVGDAVIYIPTEMGAEDESTVIEWLDFVSATMKRRVERRGTSVEWQPEVGAASENDPL